MIWTIIGTAAAIGTSSGFLFQIIKGLKTKRLDDLSVWMMITLMVGMFLWMVYGIHRRDYIIIIANIFGFSCNLFLIVLRKKYKK